VYVEGFSQSVNPLIRIHSECLTGDAFGSLKCDCGAQLKKSMRLIQQEGAGAIVYLRQEGRGIGLEAKIQAYNLQDEGYDTLDANLALGLPADARDYEIAAKMLKKKGITRVRLMTNNPLKVNGLKDNGIAVSDRVSHISGLCASNRDYLHTKKVRMGHLLDVE
jgi:GTP cyclohydrolase II